MNQPREFTVLYAEDDEEDRLLFKEAWVENRLAKDLRFVVDGEELMDYLYRRGKYNEPSRSPFPTLVLLDLNLPKKDGREALQEIKADPRLRSIPIVVVTSSRTAEDIYRTYSLGASSYIPKPVTLEALVSAVRTLGNYWFEIVELPPARY